MDPLRIALVAPVATSVPPVRSGSIETVTALLSDGLVAHGHDVTLFATAQSVTNAKLHVSFPRGYGDDSSIWPWELCELFNLAAAVERASDFDVIHCQAEYAPMSLSFSRVSPVPLVQTVHYLPALEEVKLWSRYPNAPFIAVSHEQTQQLTGLNVIATIPHAVDTAKFAYQATPDDYLLFLGRFMKRKGVLESIEVAKRTGMRLMLAAANNDYYRDVVAPLVDQKQIVYVGEVDQTAKIDLLRGARALLYPVQTGEPFGLVLAEAMVCGTPVAALDQGAVHEVVDNGVTGMIFQSLDELVNKLEQVLALDRMTVSRQACERFNIDNMVKAHIDAYSQLRKVTIAHNEIRD